VVKAHLACGVQVGAVSTLTGANTRGAPVTARPTACCWLGMPLVSSIPSSPPASCWPSRAAAWPADAIVEAFQAQDFSAERFTEYSRVMREGLENMRKLVYAFYDQGFSFRKLTDKYPDLAGHITDCLVRGCKTRISRDSTLRVAEMWKCPRRSPMARPSPGQNRRAAGMSYEFQITRGVEFSETDLAGSCISRTSSASWRPVEHAFFRSLGVF